MFYCFQEHGDGGESSERNDGDSEWKKPPWVQGDKAAFSQTAFANINEVSEGGPKSVSTTKYWMFAFHYISG